MKYRSADRQLGNVAHGGFLVVLLLTLGIGIAVQHALVDFYVEQGLNQHTQHTRHLAAQLHQQYPDIFNSMAKQGALSGSSQDTLRLAITGLWYASPSERFRFHLYGQDGRIFLASDRFEQGQLADEQMRDRLQQNREFQQLVTLQDKDKSTEAKAPVKWLYSLVPLGDKQPVMYLEISSPAENIVAGIQHINRIIVLAILVMLAAMMIWLYGLDRLQQFIASRQH